VEGVKGVSFSFERNSFFLGGKDKLMQVTVNNWKLFEQAGVMTNTQTVFD
jgi:hypothetical protein